MAPRPHNSGHHTIESCYTSQYEQHLRAVVGLPLGDPSMKAPAAIMYNILGEDEVKFFSFLFPFFPLLVFFFLQSNIGFVTNKLHKFFFWNHLVRCTFESNSSRVAKEFIIASYI